VPPALLREGPPDFATAPQLHARPRPDDWRRWLNHAGLSAVSVRDDGTFESVGLAVEADAAGLGYAIAIEGLLGPELQRGDVVRKAIETCHLSSQEEISSPSSGGGTTGSGDRRLAAVAISQYEFCTTSFHRQ
jgi:DNA-binding transcriptional LysR family regulator